MFIQSLTGLYPHRKTNTERMMNGSHARKTRPPVYLGGAAAAAPRDRATAAAGTASSSSNRHIFFGFQKIRKSTVQSNEKRPAVMSTKLLSMWLDQNHCMEAKEIPTTRIAGK